MSTDLREATTSARTPDRLVPGTLIEIETPEGPRHVQVTHARPPYPEVLRALAPDDEGGGKLEERPTAFSVMVELRRAMTRGDVRGRVLGVAPLPQDAKSFPTFRLPIRDRSGGVVYWWVWDDDGLRIDPDAGASELPLREVTPVESLLARLSAL